MKYQNVQTLEIGTLWSLDILQETLNTIHSKKNPNMRNFKIWVLLRPILEIK